ncbi:MAG: hypothetical protein ACREHF_01970 [Rhizomicrobium sp.]
MKGTKPCPIPGCPQMHAVNQLMCKRHWFRVPVILRNAVWDTCREMQRRHDAEALDAIRRYRDARDQAIEAVCAKLGLREDA